MRSQKHKTVMVLYWTLVVALTIAILVLAETRPAEATELRVAALATADADGFGAQELPSAARTRQYEDKVLFRLLDDGFTHVSVAGTFSDWSPVPLELDERSGAWSVTVTVEPGRHSYQFLIRDGDESWEAIDPSNPHARRLEERGWVSQIDVPADGAGDETAEQPEVEVTDTELKKVDINVGFHLGDDEDEDEEEGDDETWSSHNRRYLERELQRQMDPYGENVSFQRVDGLSLHIDPSAVSRDEFGPAVGGVFSYGFRSEEWTLDGVLIQPLLENRRLMAKVTGHSGTDFQDNTGIGGVENSLACVFFREDYRDYYDREGLTVSLVAYPLSNVRLEAGYESSDFASLETKETWSFADGDYAINPAVDEGTLRSYFARARLGNRFNHIDAVWESGRNREGDDFDYALLSTTYRGRLHFSPSRYLDFRVKYATGLDGELPSQRRFPVGGLGTVRGYYYQSLLTPDPNRLIHSDARGGQRMLVANFEYAVSFDTDIMWNAEAWDADWNDYHESGGIGFDSSFFVFFDSGMAWEDRSADFDLEDLKSSAGIGFQFDEDGPRFNLVKTLDDGGHDTLFQIRLERMF